MAATPLFLERKSYRKRRMMDAVRVLPFVCALMWLVIPLMWSSAAASQAATPLSTALWYLFGVWGLAVTASFALWRRNRPAPENDATPEADTAR